MINRFNLKVLLAPSAIFCFDVLCIFSLLSEIDVLIAVFCMIQYQIAFLVYKHLYVSWQHLLQLFVQGTAEHPPIASPSKHKKGASKTGH